MVTCSAPGKLILFGEHAVVFGEPALSTAINLRTRVTGQPSSEPRVNGRPMEKRRHSYIKRAVEMAWTGEPLDLRVDSDLPSASGMGSSAAVTVATLGFLMESRGNLSKELLAERAFEVEYSVQGRASPIDTTTSCQGSGIFLNREKVENFLWMIEKNDQKWFLHARGIPHMRIVIGDTGIQARTGPLVENVRKLTKTSAFARQVVQDIGRIALEGVKAMANEDFERIGKLMTQNHKLLNTLGVGHELLDRYVQAALPMSYGAKLTGAGGGGSMIALTDQPVDVAKRLEELGGKTYIVETEGEGVLIKDG